MPSKRSGIGAVSVNDTLYVFGGKNLTNTFNNNEGFNVKNNTWNIEKPIPTARHALGVSSFDGKIHVIGGGPDSGLSATNVNQIFTIR